MKCLICSYNVPDNELFCEKCGMRVNLKQSLFKEHTESESELTSPDGTIRTFSDWSRHWAELCVRNYHYWTYLVHEHIDDESFDISLIVCIHQFQSLKDMHDAYDFLREYGEDSGYGVPSDYVFMSEDDNQWYVFLPCSDLPIVLLVAEHYNGKICGWSDYFIPMPTMPICMDKLSNVKFGKSQYAPVKTKIRIKNMKSLLQRHLENPNFKRMDVPSACVKTRGVVNGHEYVDLGLPSGVKWATCNVGANRPEDYGNYYAWGETSTKSSYAPGNSKTYGKSMGDISGNANYDAARANWGGNWRMPTASEMKELHYKCSSKWTTQNGVKGYKYTGPNGNSLFFPAAGYRSDNYVQDVPSSFNYCDVFVRGRYWSSTPFTLGLAFHLSISDNDSGGVGDFTRASGLSVRPVLEGKHSVLFDLFSEK